ncbi:MAG: ATP-binding protein [Elusimicrobia bacterium]|nr:ATP-binding protein [Elusimicrobiota bacterium]
MKFIVDARAILRLGRDSIRDHTTAVVELVKNSYDAGAKQVEIEICPNATPPFLRIADNGDGMNDTELESNWLRIGFSRKAEDRFSGERRRRTGEKGIGRLSADRLGADLDLLTKTRGGKPHGLRVDWNQFDVDGKTLESVDLPILDASDINLPPDESTPAKAGTELRIHRLRQAWTQEDVEALYLELSLLISPFQTLSDFKIFLFSDAWKKKRVEVTTQVPTQAQLDFDGVFDGKSLTYDISQRGKSKKSDVFSETMPWNKLLQEIGQGVEDDAVNLGPVKVKLLLFIGKSEVLGAKGFSINELRTFLRENAGVRIYRDFVRVKPYGEPKDPQGDWLGLAGRRSGDPAGVGRKTYKIAPNQLVGAVFVGRDSNAGLVDSSSREGLVHDEQYYALRKLVLACVRLLESYRHKTYKAEQAKSPADKAKESAGQVSARLETLQDELRTMRSAVPPTHARALDRFVDETAAIAKTASLTEKSIEDLIQQSALYRGLATIGIASAVFGHETQSAIDEFKMAAEAAQAQLTMSPPRTPVAIKELTKAINFSDRVASWGAFALARVQYEKRRRRERELKSVFEDLLQHIVPIFESANITMTPVFEPIRAKVFEMDIESILLNLLTNAYHACQQVTHERKVLVSLARTKVDHNDGYTITVSDSGPGVAERYLFKIWEPLFSTKVDRHGKQIGTGLGLTIVRSIAEDLHGSASVDRDPTLNGARFKVWLPN